MNSANSVPILLPLLPLRAHPNKRLLIVDWESPLSPLVWIGNWARNRVVGALEIDSVIAFIVEKRNHIRIDSICCHKTGMEERHRLLDTKQRAHPPAAVTHRLLLP